jgi:hypothetical protein
MKKAFTTLMIAFVAVIALNKAAAQPEVTTGAKIEFDKEVHDYGTVKYDGNGECVFEFTNTGNAPLILSDAKGSCSCTVPEWPKEPIAPGAKGKITVKYNTKNAGPINKSVTITSNAANDPVKVLRIKGTVSPQADAAPVNPAGAPANN